MPTRTKEAKTLSLQLTSGLLAVSPKFKQRLAHRVLWVSIENIHKPLPDIDLEHDFRPARQLNDEAYFDEYRIILRLKFWKAAL